MPRVRGTGMAPRVSTRGPASLRTSSSDSDPPHHRSGSKFRSPRSAHSEPLNQKKLGTRIAGLETQLEQAQGELKILKDQVATAEVAKKEAQKELERKRVPVQDARSSPSDSNNETDEVHESPDDNQNETDVFEVPVEMVTGQTCDQDELKVNISPESPRFEEAIAAKNEEISSLKQMIEEKEVKLEALGQENDDLKRQLTEANAQMSFSMVKEQKLNKELTRIEEEFKKSKNDGIQLEEKLKEVEGAKEVLETEMKKLRVQTEQWRKAADAAASVLAGGGMDVNHERCGSMEKHYGGMYEGFVGSPLSDDGFGNVKRKGSGMRMFGDLWKKKGHK
ncbi:hypothetical protein R6Q57_028778 [Mikania cordata]